MPVTFMVAEVIADYSVEDVFCCTNFGRQLRKSKELLTTLTLLSAIAAPASVGVSMPAAASGMPTTL